MTDNISEERAEDWFTQTFGPVIQANKLIIAQYDAQYAKRPSSSSSWLSPGPFVSAAHTEQKTTLRFQDALILCEWIQEDVIRLRLIPGQTEPSEEIFSYAVVTSSDAFQAPASALRHEDQTLRLEQAQTALELDTQSSILRVHRASNLLVSGIRLFWNSNGAVRMTFNLADGEGCYGTGQRTFDLNLRGQHLTFWNTDAGAYVRGFEPINYCIPFYIGVHDGGAYGLFWDNSYRATLDLGRKDQQTADFQAAGGEMRVYLFCGGTIEKIMADFTWLTGRMPLPPRWALGYHQCRFSYADETAVLEVAQELRSRQIPCDAIYLDIDYMDGKRIFTWDKRAFPDLHGLADQLHRMNLRLVAILDPGVKVEEGYPVYDAGIEEGVFMTYPDGQPAAGVVWPGLCNFPDFSNPSVRAWWARQMRPLLDAGVDGIWNDMNEPLYFGAGKTDDPPDYVQHHKEGLGGNHAEIHNVYGMLMARASREALESHHPTRRPFVITRAGFAGAQRYASSWTGDNQATWDNLRQSIAMQLNLALSGQSFTGADIGGFAGDTSPELLARWTQAGALMPFFRNHSAHNSIRQEPYQFGAEIERICREAIELRYQLMPYLYTQFVRCSREGLPVIRPIFSAEPHNRVARQIDDAFLLGEHLLVAPVVSACSVRRLVYLPAGTTWFDFWDQSEYEGGQWLSVEAPLSHLPIFVRAGTVLPVQSVTQHSDACNYAPLMLRCYPGEGKTLLYEDAGEGYAYKTGGYRLTYFTLTNGDQVNWKHEGSFTPAYSWRFQRLFQGQFSDFQP